jgi:dimethylamine/trimethylamine dehydrogenase
VEIVTHRVLAGFDGTSVRLACVFTGREIAIEAGALVPVTARAPDDALYRALASDPEALAAAGIVSLDRLGDCAAPGTIAAAVYAGHRYARELGDDDRDSALLRREVPAAG